MTIASFKASGPFVRRAALLGTALTALALAGCATGGPQDAGDVAGRQAPGTPPAGITEATILSIAERTRATGDYAAAVTFYRRAVAIDSSDPRPLIGLGETLNLAGSPNEAMEVYRRAYALAPSNPEVLRGYGVTLVALGQPAAAIDMFHKALAAAPDARSYGGLGVAEDMLGDYQAANEAHRQALALAPRDINLKNNYGLSQALAGDYEGAIQTLREVASDPHAAPRHRLNLALVLGIAGHTDEAAQVARIDLDERSVRSNLAYYAELRALPAQARAQAILEPNAGIHGRGAVIGCKGATCDPAAPEKQGAASPEAKAADTPAPAPVTAVERRAIATAEPARKPARADAAPSAADAKSAAPTERRDGISKMPAPVAPPAEASAGTASAEETSKERAALIAPPAEPAAAVAPSEPPAAATPGNAAPAAESAPATLLPSASPDAEATVPGEDTPAALAGMPVDAGEAAAALAPSSAAEPEPAEAPAGAFESGDAANALDAAPAPARPAPSASAGTSAAADPPTQRKPELDGAVAHGPAQLGAMPEHGSLPATQTLLLRSDLGGRWIQLGALRDAETAERTWRTIAAGNDDLLGGVGHAIRRTDLGADKGVYFRLRAGPLATIDTARGICSALKSRSVPCFVVAI